MRHRKSVWAALVMGLLLFGAAEADAGVWYSRYWGLDAQTVWSYQPTYTTVPTGYWGGAYPYSWGGYSWSAYHGWRYPYSGYYHGYYGSAWGWGAPSWYYGFTDSYTYRTFYAWPRTVYSWSRYWDPDDTAYTMDIWTQVDENADTAMAFFPEEVEAGVFENIDGVVDFQSHDWSINGGRLTGNFTDLQWVTASPAAVQNYLQAEGFDTATINDILSEQILEDAFASNFDGNVYGNGLIGLQWTSAPIADIPEPASLALLTVGGLVLLRRRK